MIDFKKATSKLRYDKMQTQHGDMFHQIVAFSSTFGGSEGVPVSVRAQVEEYCMGIALEMFRRGQNEVRDLVRR